MDSTVSFHVAKQLFVVTQLHTCTHIATMDGKLTNLPISHDISLGNNQYNIVFKLP